MTTPQATAPTAKTARILHGAMFAGVLLFAIFGSSVLRPTSFDSEVFPPGILTMLLCLSLGACALALLLRRRVPKRVADGSADSFWATASQPAITVWASLESAGLLAVFVYIRTHSVPSVVVAAVATLLLLVLNPAHFENR